MTRIYIIRHCEALGNVEKIFQGTTDLDITDLGQKQLVELEKRFKPIPLDRVLSSPLIRTQKTAKAIIGNKNLTLEIDNDLIEMNGGVIEGKPILESFKKYPELCENWVNSPHKFAPPDGESYQDVYNRAWKVIKRIAEENKGKTIACATHGAVTKCIICKFLFDDITKLIDTPYSINTAVSLIEFDDDFNYKLVFYNDYSHLTDDLINNKSCVVESVEENE